jgi:hypothetical protein
MCRGRKFGIYESFFTYLEVLEMNDMEKFVENYCKKYNLNLCDLSSDELNKLCSSWVIESMGMSHLFKTMDEWKKENE